MKGGGNINTSLMQTASTVGGKSYAIFQSPGYKGLYGGLSMQDIHTRKKLKISKF